MQRKQRTTHSDLADIILAHRERLKAIPAGYCVSDASTLKCLEDIARIVVEQDERIGAFTIALRATGNREAIAALLSKRAAHAR